jgi:hypothetical protein
VARLLKVTMLIVAVLALSAGVTTGCGGTESSSNGSQASVRTFTRDDWGELAAAPDGFKGARVDIVGSVLGEPTKDGNVTYWQMWPHPTNVDWMAVVGFEDSSFTIADGDYVHVVGTVQGETKGRIPLLATLDAVAVRAETVEVVEESAAAPPALRTVVVAKSVEQHRLIVTVDKVEFAANETRVYVTVSNQSTASASFNGYKTRAVQGQTEYKPPDLSPYPWVEQELPPGAVSSGVVLLPGTNRAQAVKLSFEPRTDDYQVEFSPYIFEIAAE